MPRSLSLPLSPLTFISRASSFAARSAASVSALSLLAAASSSFEGRALHRKPLRVGLNLLQQVFEPGIVVAYPGPGLSNHFVRHADPMRHVQAVTSAGPARYQPVCGQERYRIKFHGRVHGASLLGPEKLERVVVRRDEGHRAPVDQTFKYGRAESRAFCRVGAGPELVEEHE